MTDRQTPRDVLRETIKNNPGASQKEVEDLCWERCKYREHARLIFKYWFENQYRSFEIESSAHASVVRDRAKAIRETTKVVDRMRESLKVALLDQLLPNGQFMREAKREYLIELGGKYSAVASVLKPGQVVGNQLTETELSNVWNRNNKPTGKRVA